MGEVHRADVLVRWIGLLPFVRGTGPDRGSGPVPEAVAGPERDPGSTGPDGEVRPWQAGRRRAGAASVPEPRSPSSATPPGAAPPPGPRPVAPERPLAPRRPAPPAPRRRGAIVDGIEHRPPIGAEADRGGLSRRLSGRRGSRLYALLFVGVYLVILVQLIVVLMNH